ncbi:MAG: hypothetical protein OK456_03650 [Thaumarchaeota archaeon]|nr:hypothetical protein [Nitrososphaerota archaeon]
MNARATLVLLLVVSLAIIPVLAPTLVRAQSSSSYSERIDIYTAGVNSYSVITMDQLNRTSSALSSAETGSGATGYKLTALSGQNQVADYQLFGVDGYNLLHIPFLPAEGLFLQVNGSSAASATPLISYFDGLFATNFTSVSSSGDSYLFYASVNFDTVAAPVLFELVPTSQGGFSLAYTESQFSGFALPSIVLQGELSATNGTYTHTISLGDAATGVLKSSAALDFLQAVSQSNTTISASNSSEKSLVVVHALDGYVSSSDNGSVVSNSETGMSGTYTLTATPGKTVAPNVVIHDEAPTLNAYRTVSLSTVGGSQYLAVTIFLANTAQNDTATGQDSVVQNLTVDDNWWQQDSSLFQPASSNQNYSKVISAFGGGRNTTMVYSLKVVTSNQSQFTIPATKVSYSYTLGGKVIDAHATLNEVNLQLNNNPEPALNVYAQPSRTDLSGSPIGTNATLVITVVNDGSAPATNLKVANQTLTDLPANGASQTFTATVPFTGLLDGWFNQTYTLQWTTPSLQNENITSNSVSLLYTHSAMVIPYLEIGGSDTFTAAALASGSFDVTYGFTNAGTASTGPITGSQVFPAGVTCSALNTTLATCNGNVANINITSVAPSSPKTFELRVNFTRDDFIVNPATVTEVYRSTALHTAGGPYIIPGGLSLTKSFSPEVLFPGMSAISSVGFANRGSQTLYNVTVSSTPDSFDTVAAGASTQAFYAKVPPQQNESFQYPIKVGASAPGNLNGTLPSVTIYLGGQSQEVSAGASTLLVYKPISASVSLGTASPSDGHNFDITFTVNNTAPVSVSNVTLTWHLPSGLSLVAGGTSSNGVVSQSFPSLGANSVQNLTLTVRANIGLTFDTATGNRLTYEYQNSTINGVVESHQVTVAEDLTSGYLLPIVIAVVIALAAVYYMRRNVAPVVASAPPAAPR